MSAIICPDSCINELPVVSFSDCNPIWNEGQIKRIYLTNIGQTFPDNLVDFMARLSNTSTDVDAIRELVVMGSKPAPTKTEIQLSDNRKVYSKKTHTIPFKIDEVSQENYDFVRQLECGSRYLMIYAGGNYLYGGENFSEGIEVDITLDDIHPESDKDLNTLDGQATWDAKFHPTRVDNFLL